MAKRHMGTKGKKKVFRQRKKSEAKLKTKTKSDRRRTAGGGGQRSTDATKKPESSVSSTPKSILKKRSAEFDDPSANGVTTPLAERTAAETGEQSTAVRKRPRLVISKSDKAHLLTLQSKARRRFIRALKLKQDPKYEIIHSAKLLYVKLRKNKKNNERIICGQIYETLKGEVLLLAYRHDLVRIFQACLKFGGKEVVENIFNEVKDEILQMAKSKYARHMVVKFLKYGTVAHREHIFKAFRTSMPELARHVFGSDVIAYLYAFSGSNMRREIIKEFLGAAAVFADVGADVDTIFLNSWLKKIAMQSLKANILHFAEKPVLQSLLVHRLLRIYLEYCETNVAEIVTVFAPHVLQFVHTFDGVLVALYILWNSTPKMRNMIVKSTREHVVKICTDGHAYLFLLSMLDVVDETEVLQNFPLREVLANVDTLLSDTYGRKVLNYLFAGRNCSNIVPQHLELLARGDNNENTKKSLQDKHVELIKLISPTALEYVVKHTDELMQDSSKCIFLLSFLQNGEGDMTPVYENICHYCIQNEGVLSQTTHIGFLLAKLMGLEKGLHDNGEQNTFSSTFAKLMPKKIFKSLRKSNAGSFVLLRLFETKIPSVEERVRKVLDKIEPNTKVEHVGLRILLEKAVV